MGLQGNPSIVCCRRRRVRKLIISPNLTWRVKVQLSEDQRTFQVIHSPINNAKVQSCHRCRTLGECQKTMIVGIWKLKRSSSTYRKVKIWPTHLWPVRTPPCSWQVSYPWVWHNLQNTIDESTFDPATIRLMNLCLVQSPCEPVLEMGTTLDSSHEKGDSWKTRLLETTPVDPLAVSIFHF